MQSILGQRPREQLGQKVLSQYFITVTPHSAAAPRGGAAGGMDGGGLVILVVLLAAIRLGDATTEDSRAEVN